MFEFIHIVPVCLDLCLQYGFIGTYVAVFVCISAFVSAFLFSYHHSLLISDCHRGARLQKENTFSKFTD